GSSLPRHVPGAFVRRLRRARPAASGLGARSLAAPPPPALVGLREHRLEVRVVVDDGVRQRLGVLGPVRAAVHSPCNLASSCSTRSSSSLVNTGLGAPIGVPGTTGTEAQACAPE